MIKAKAIALLSGGLDSILAVKLLQDQKIEVITINFSSSFFSEKKALEATRQLKTKLIRVDLNKGKDFQEYIKMIKRPRHGYGSAVNPCIDCKIFMFKKAKQVMKKEKAAFIVTGEVLNERPMSQTKHALMLIEKEAGLKGKILRPLSAKLLPKTEAEKKKFVDRNKLLAIEGRRRIQQIVLAKKYKISYPTPAGGCLLCEKVFASKLIDLFKHKKKIEPRDIELLKIGRHFRYKKNKIIIGRNEQENKKLMKLAKNLIFEVKDWPSPITLLEGKVNKRSIQLAAALTAPHSDAKHEKKCIVRYGKRKLNKSIEIFPINKEKVEKLRI
ncbi:MAG: tRNA 4-thiouridine(8) synthase ThiI [Candidatus Pacearchaeota archaeon]|nr:MAG: tRNA 4-thiouridine(8) synthase ThiI [Candidatus Pacearchaeota archaeon]